MSRPAAATVNQAYQANAAIAAWKTIMDFPMMDAKHATVMLMGLVVCNVTSPLERAIVCQTLEANTATDARRTSTT
jgi:hypothetical protein